MKLAGKKAIVTGGARGLGRAYALRLAALGADVAIIDLKLDGAAEYGEALAATSVAAEIEQLGRRGIGLEADLSVNAQVQQAIEKIAASFGGLDVRAQVALRSIGAQRADGDGRTQRAVAGRSDGARLGRPALR